MRAEISDGVEPFSETSQTLQPVEHQTRAEHKLLLRQQRPAAERPKEGMGVSANIKRYLFSLEGIAACTEQNVETQRQREAKGQKQARKIK